MAETPTTSDWLAVAALLLLWALIIFAASY